MTVVTVTQHICNQCGVVEETEPGEATETFTWLYLKVDEAPREVTRSGHFCCVGCACEWLRCERV